MNRVWMLKHHNVQRYVSRSEPCLRPKSCRFLLPLLATDDACSHGLPEICDKLISARQSLLAVLF